MSGIWLCHLFHAGGCTASLERNKRVRRAEAFPVGGEEEAKRQKEKRYRMYKGVFKN